MKKIKISKLILGYTLQYLLLILIINISKADWDLVFNDEFNNKIIDLNKWNIENLILRTGI